MKKAESIRPDYVGMHWLLPSQGFDYVSKPATNSEVHHRASDEWVQLLLIFERLKEGAFAEDVALFRLISDSPDRDIRCLGLRILGHSASRECRLAMSNFFQHSDRETRMAAYDAVLYSCDLHLLEPLLLARRASEGQERLAIMSTISHLLENEPDKLYDDTDELGSDEYEETARAATRAIERAYGRNNAIFEGRLLSLPYILQRIELLCGDPEADAYSGTISTYFDLFEAMTGFPTKGVFDEEVAVNCDYAAGLISNFHQIGHKDHFKLGHRYFFGHKIPS